MSFAPTTEQSNIFTAVNSGDNVLINAFAGTGKTSTLAYIANNYPIRALYLAFNKTASEEAKLRFPANVTCQTVHSLAYGSICKGTSFGKRLKNYYDYKEIAAMVGSFTTPKEEGKFVDSVIEVVKKFCNSDYTTLDEIAVEFPEYIPEVWDVVYKAADIVWKAMSDKLGRASITHDIYLKLYQLSKPKLTAYGLIMLDEAQDSNPVTLDIVRNQDCQRILVGDRYQSIYAWRGSVNAMDSFPTFKVMYLTESFRFGQEIADKANIVLAALGSPVSMLGRGKATEVSVRATLVRTNANLFSCMLSHATHGDSIYVEADLKELWSAMYTLNSMRYAHFNGGQVDWPKFPNKQYQAYGTWDKVQQVESPEISRIVKLVAAGNGHKEIQTIKCALVEDKSKADVILVTGHKSKGLEYDSVTIADDFVSSEIAKDGLNKETWKNYVADQGANLLYVALTRAKVETICQDGVEALLDNISSM